MQASKKKKPKKRPELSLVALLKKYLIQKKVSEHVDVIIPDPRNPKKITYSKNTIFFSALAIFLLRMSSGNRFDELTHSTEGPYTEANVSRFIDSHNKIPTIKTIQDFLKKVSYTHFNRLMIDFFKQLQESKFFSSHPELLPKKSFHLAIDLVHTHTYYSPHHTDSEGENDCSHCLKRVHNKGTPKERVSWQHNLLVLCFVFPGHLKIPVHIYPIQSQQVDHLKELSNDKHKQECELVALKKVIPTFLEFFSRMPITVLLDGLYANNPTINLLEKHKLQYLIVRKEGCLKSLGEDCRGLASSKEHRKNHRFKETISKQKEKASSENSLNKPVANLCKKRPTSNNSEEPIKKRIEQTYEWFNDVNLGKNNKKVNVLWFDEEEYDEEGKLVRKYHNEWLVSWKLSKATCTKTASRARLRWEEEDLFNTLKRRGFCLKHDYSWNPTAMISWQAIMFFAFGVFELFRFSKEVMKRWEGLAIVALVETIKGLLFFSPTAEIFSKEALGYRMQFRYDFRVLIDEYG